MVLTSPTARLLLAGHQIARRYSIV